MFSPHGLENQITFNPTVNIRCPEVFPTGYSWPSELTLGMVCQPIKALLKAQKAEKASHTRKMLRPFFLAINKM